MLGSGLKPTVSSIFITPDGWRGEGCGYTHTLGSGLKPIVSSIFITPYVKTVKNPQYFQKLLCNRALI
jgi:hypothetical protein